MSGPLIMIVGISQPIAVFEQECFRLPQPHALASLILTEHGQFLDSRLRFIDTTGGIPSLYTQFRFVFRFYRTAPTFFQGCTPTEQAIWLALNWDYGNCLGFLCDTSQAIQGHFVGSKVSCSASRAMVLLLRVRGYCLWLLAPFALIDRDRGDTYGFLFWPMLVYISN